MIVFFVEGTGFGHASRTWKVIKDLDGLAISFGDGAKFLKSKGVNVIEISQNYMLKFDNSSLDLSATLFELIKRIKIEDLKKIKDIYSQADIVVVDSSLLGIVVAKSMKKKIVMITNNPSASAMINGITGDIVDRLVNTVIDMVDRIVIPDLPPPFTISLSNISGDLAKYTFIGPTVDVSDIKRGESDYILFTNGAGFESDVSIDVGKIKAISKNGLNIKGKNVKFVDNARDYMGKAKAIVSHGGHSTIMESILLGKPMIFMPNPVYGERINNIHGMEALGIGMGIKPEFINETTLEIALSILNEKRKFIKEISKIAKSMNGQKRLIEIINEYL